MAVKRLIKKKLKEKNIGYEIATYAFLDELLSAGDLLPGATEDDLPLRGAVAYCRALHFHSRAATVTNIVYGLPACACW
jgi:hypothetical protein